jgi:hypothetical protein
MDFFIFNATRVQHRPEINRYAMLTNIPETVFVINNYGSSPI